MLKTAAVIAILFGAATLISGGAVLFGSEGTRLAMGDVVQFVLWFNFVAGVFYILCGAGLLVGKTWALWLSVLILITTAGVFAAFGWHVLQGGEYELRTAGAMTLRTAVWLAIFWTAKKRLH
ncbi:hypothetical protein [Hoeflea sp. TYP-13]|uniref:hypothetical protein n=1 Tax=Hoeflea sp. TYP-13 TaxID=3230023 RepID=UPI0034C5EA61